MRRTPSGIIASSLVLLFSIALPAVGQTGLVLVTQAHDSGWTPRLQRVASGLHWTRGPLTTLIIDGSGDARARWETTRDALRARGATTLLVLGVFADKAPASSGWADVFADETRGVHVLPALLGTGPLSDALLSRRIQSEATGAIAATSAARDETPFTLQALNVTATRDTRERFLTPAAVTVVGRRELEERNPNTISDLLADVPGLDVVGVGANQRLPVIRGLEGQRVLLLEDGLRMNNSRRRQDSGELPALVDVSHVERVEVVRGASSVLYGSDAIGGVINLVTRRPGFGSTGSEVHGSLAYRYSTADNQNRIDANMRGHRGRLSFRAGGSFRTADSYDAPSGTFGDVALGQTTRVQDTGVDDYSVSAYAGYAWSDRHRTFASFERYRADDAGFGYVTPAELGDANGATVQLLFPFQDADKLTLGYEGSNLGLPVADGLQVQAYWRSTDRRFNTNVTIPMGPGAEIQSRSRNFTDLDTYGFRIEARKVVGARQLLTYGADLFRDRSDNTDSSTRTVIGLGPTTVTEDDTPRVPNATLRSIGLFAQDEITVSDRWSVTLGLRYQDVAAHTKETDGITEPLLSATDRTVVGAGNVLFHATDAVSLVASVGRAFRSPNLVERFYTGPAPSGRGFWIRNPELRAETSVNVDVGVRAKLSRAFLEAFVFQNEIRHGIRTEPTGNTVNNVTEYQSVNIDKLRYRGIEITGGGEVASGLTVSASYTHLDAKDVNQPDHPLGDTYANKVTGTIRYALPRNVAWVEYRVRHNAARGDVELGTSPVGDDLPAFTVHSVSGSVRLFERVRLGVALQNLTNALYAEFPNAAFFRPEPKRNLVVTWGWDF